MHEFLKETNCYNAVNGTWHNVVELLPMCTCNISELCASTLGCVHLSRGNLAECHLCIAIAVCFAIWLCVICILQCCVLYSAAVCHPLIAISACFNLLAVCQSYYANTPEDALGGEYYYIRTVVWRSYDICQHYRPCIHSLQLCYLEFSTKMAFNQH